MAVLEVAMLLEKYVRAENSNGKCSFCENPSRLCIYVPATKAAFFLAITTHLMLLGTQAITVMAIDHDHDEQRVRDTAQFELADCLRHQDNRALSCELGAGT